MSKPVLTQTHGKTLTELLNIGIAIAGTNLSEIIEKDVHLSVFSVEFMTRIELINSISNNDHDTITCIKQGFSGSFWGNALLIFPEIQSLSLVKAMTDDVLSIDNLSDMDKDMEQDVVSEIGNIILNSCLGSLANVLGDTIRSEIPVCMIGTSEEVLFSDAGSESVNTEHVMRMRLDFDVPGMNANGHVVFLLDVDSISHLQDEIDNYLQPLYKKNTG